MDTFIQKFHSGWAYLALLLLVVAIINAAFGRNNPFKDKDRKISLFALIACHIQLLIGLFLYFISPLGFKLFENVGTSQVMKTAAYRLTAVEHPIINILALVLITIGWSKHKKATTDAAKFKSIKTFYAIGLILILSRLPWNLWF